MCLISGKWPLAKLGVKHGQTLVFDLLRDAASPFTYQLRDQNISEENGILGNNFQKEWFIGKVITVKK